MRFKNQSAFTFLLVSWFCPFLVSGQQEIPIGTWRFHLSFNSINHIALQGVQRVFASSTNGIMVLDRSGSDLSVYTKLNGLHGGNITAIGFHDFSQALLISYADGVFDLLDIINHEIIGIDPTNNSLLTGSARINNIFINGDIAYLSTDYGVIVFDLLKRQIKETWRDLGPVGESLSIVDCAIGTDSVFLATQQGVMAGSLDDNLQDFNNWKRFNTAPFNGPIMGIELFHGKIYTAINGAGIYRRENGVWNLESFLSGASFKSMQATASSLIVTTASELWKLLTDSSTKEIEDASFTQPQFATEDTEGKLWIGDHINGLVSDATGTYTTFHPNSPANYDIVRLYFSHEKIYGLGGGYTEKTPLQNRGVVDILANGAWSSYESAMLDLTDIVVDPSGKIFTSSFGYGLEFHDSEGNKTILNESNSPLININPPARAVNVTALAEASSGLWVANYGAGKSLHFLMEDGNWKSFELPGVSAKYPTRMITDLSGNVWMALEPQEGGGILVFNEADNATKHLDAVEDQGGLPSNAVHCLSLDRDGLVWVGTDLGVAYFINSGEIFNATVNAIRPIVDGRFLLRDDKVTSMSVDGGNRKWFGTERGVWLYNAEGDKPLENFTADNSPLASNNIHDIAINQATGEVFFATTGGLVSFRSGATGIDAGRGSLKIFPNPVTSNFSGTVGISGTPLDAIVKITDVSGKLVWQTQANGGTATWNLRDNTGRHVPTGVYLVFTITADGDQHMASKIAVVE